jgi:beta-galactosidase
VEETKRQIRAPSISPMPGPAQRFFCAACREPRRVRIFLAWIYLPKPFSMPKSPLVMEPSPRFCRGAGVSWAAFLLMTAAFVSPSVKAQEPPSARERISFNAGWRFQKDDPADAAGKLDYANLKPWINATGADFKKDPAASAAPESNAPGADVAYTQPGFDDSGWRSLNLPHDWGIEGPFDQKFPGETGKLPWWGVGWYRKSFDVPAADKGKRLYLDVDGAMSHAAVWLNGKLVGGWPYGYSSWRVDLTPHLKPGEKNVLALRLDNPNNSSRWYPGGGIYRNVWLVKTSPVHIAQWGTYITTPQVSKEEATVELQMKIENSTGAKADLHAKTELFELAADGQSLVGAPIASLTSQQQVGEREAISQRFTFKTPKLWSTDKPNLYAAVTTLEQNGAAVDRYQTNFGVRTIQFDAEKGFLLNGERLSIKGVCNHHDLGALGAAINTRALQRQLEILREMGDNAIRTSHNPPAPELLDLCDRMGFIVMAETFDCWAAKKTNNDYATLFADWHEKDTRALVRRDRNHPSVILWSIGNEIREQGSPAGHVIASELAGIVHEEDLTRPVTAGCNDLRAGYNGFQKTVDVFGYNYKPFEYGKFREKNPTIPLFGSETSSCISSRGEYFFPVVDDKSKGLSNFQMSSYDLYAPRWATTPDSEFEGQEKFPFTAGEFVWTGFDYLGEPTPYSNDSTNLLNFTDPAEQAKMKQELEAMGKIAVPSRSSYFGIVDLAGFKKDRFYLYQAHWRPELPMAHILPHWNWPDRVGEVTPVHVYTSGDEAELFLNGKSLGRKKKEPLKYRLRWDEVKYEPGELKVVAYKDGKSWAEETVKTTGPAAKLTLQPDRAQITADGQDLSFVTVAVADESGQMVPRTKNRIRFEIDGPGEIVATDNGDATSFESFQSKERNAFNGLCLVIVRTKAGQSGQITLKASAEGLKDAQTVIAAK